MSVIITTSQVVSLAQSPKSVIDAAVEVTAPGAIVIACQTEPGTDFPELRNELEALFKDRMWAGVSYGFQLF